MTPVSPWMKLSVHFDVDQITNQLDYNFTSCDGTADPRHGPYMGGVHFQQGQHVYLDVTCCGSEKSGFTSFQIVDCCIISVPQLTQIGPKVPTVYSPPSPFLQAVGATYSLPLDFEAKVLLGEQGDPAQPPLRRILQAWKHNLDVGYATGRWELSFVMTVRIMRGEGVQPELRVFSFDPESSVGGTYDWN
ncbi:MULTISPECIES: hypothetical protein [unclassified Janthinobacterium]|uniref:hypothetical protein n=1 Tax=unclassified Janthinobacterium TaxID=2610881 RepID=UPI00088ED1A8|nr:MULTISPECIES: hypothetical protein [unclassified Janthinobacterium]SDA43545.1 hypothetical protein SAMN03159349_00758 [Janthinobacterium sp. 551a]SFA91870.1 hypothetical protein SAMN03159300_101759 [Janthinobacterium sp. 344]